jgi:hypothetical protein
MIIATVELEGISPYSQSKHHTTAKKERELPKDYEERTWRERMHVNKDGYVFIPPMAFKNCIAEIAKFLSVQIPGKGKSTYTKHFEAGILVTEEVLLPFKKADVQGEWLFLPSDGKRGSGTRVDKCYPVIPEWKATVVFYVLDQIITEDVFTDHLNKAGQFIGIGRFRPRNNGFYGRFRVLSVNWQQA